MSAVPARHSFFVALGDLAFATSLFSCGLFAAPPWLTALAGVAMIGYWSASRRRVLRRLPARALTSLTGLAISVIVAIEAGAYWLGLGLAGSF
jgi:uncharacterized membrane protein